MAKTQDMTAVLKDMMGAFPVDTAAFQDAFKNTASLNEKLAGVALNAAEKSSEIGHCFCVIRWLCLCFGHVGQLR